MKDIVSSYLENQMSIDAYALEEDLKNNLIADDRELVHLVIDDFVSVAIKCGSDKNSVGQNQPSESINNIFNQAKFKTDKAYYYCDAIRYAFTHFVDGGLLQLYEHQQNECWFPKLVLKDELKPNDISTLPEMVTIYRGCDISECHAREYKQAWTTNKNVAKQFAYVHYQGQEWFKEAHRVVLMTTISKSDIFYSKQSSEFEVVINTDKLDIDGIHIFDRYKPVS